MISLIFAGQKQAHPEIGAYCLQKKILARGEPDATDNVSRSESGCCCADPHLASSMPLLIT